MESKMETTTGVILGLYRGDNGKQDLFEGCLRAYLDLVLGWKVYSWVVKDDFRDWLGLP